MGKNFFLEFGRTRLQNQFTPGDPTQTHSKTHTHTHKLKLEHTHTISLVTNTKNTVSYTHPMYSNTHTLSQT